MDGELIKKYETEDMTIIWKPQKCIHAAVCVSKLPNVYKPKEKPWITPENASTEELKEQIAMCPSGALSYQMRGETKTNLDQGGGDAVAADSQPMLVDLQSGKKYAWCACGKSDGQPWCDGSHKGSGLAPMVFEATEDKKAAMCMCKQTKNPPYCDGSHASL